MKFRIIIFLVYILISNNSNVFAEEDPLPKFLQEMSSEDIKHWNDLHIKLSFARSNNNLDEAIRVCNEILSIDKLSGEISLAETYKLAGDDREAIKWAEKALNTAKRQKVSTEKPLLIIASCNLLIGDYAKAIKTMDEIINLYPNSPMGYKFYAQYYEKIGDRKNAIVQWQEALKRFTDERAIQQTKERIKFLESQSAVK